jgi:hypothetical protein
MSNPGWRQSVFTALEAAGTVVAVVGLIIGSHPVDYTLISVGMATVIVTSIVAFLWRHK